MPTPNRYELRYVDDWWTVWDNEKDTPAPVDQADLCCTNRVDMLCKQLNTEDTDRRRWWGDRRG